MKIRVGAWTGVGLVLLGAAAAGVLPAWGQAFPGPEVNLTAGGLVPLPPPPPKGAWGEVIMANERWIVVQNSDGQQFPISADAINQFLVRWPTNFDSLTNQSWVEVMGMELGSNTLRTGHVDVYEGADRTLVQPTYKSLLPGNRVVTVIDPTFQRMMNTFDVAAQNTLYGWVYPIYPGGNGIPSQLYAVGNALNRNPQQFQLGVPGNNVVTAVPEDPAGLSISQVTRGTASVAKKGDVAFLIPVDLNAKTLVLSQLVLYKKIPLKEFVP